MFSLRRLTIQAARARPSSLTSSTFSISRASRPHNLAELRTFESLLQMRWNSSTGVTEIPPEEQSMGSTVGSPLVGGRMRQGRPKTPAQPSEEVYVGNLSFYTNEEQLREFASQYGNVEQAKLVYDRRGLSKGFGYIRYSTKEEAAEALEKMHGALLDNRNMVVQFSARANQYGRPSEPTKTLFVGNMSYDITDEDLNEIFKNIRNCVDVRVAVDRRTAQPRGFAHCDFVDVESAAKARAMLEGLKVRGRTLRCDFSSHLPGKGLKPLAMDPEKTNFDHSPRLRRIKKQHQDEKTASSGTKSTENPTTEAPSTGTPTNTSSTEAPPTTQ